MADRVKSRKRKKSSAGQVEVCSPLFYSSSAKKSLKFLSTDCASYFLSTNYTIRLYPYVELLICSCTSISN